MNKSSNKYQKLKFSLVLATLGVLLSFNANLVLAEGIEFEPEQPLVLEEVVSEAKSRPVGSTWLLPDKDGKIEITQDLAGDVYCLTTGVVKVEADIAGDLICMASEIHLGKVTIGGALRVATSTELKLDGTVVSGNATVASGHRLSTNDEVKFEGDLLVFGGVLNLKGSVLGQAVLSGQEVSLFGGFDQDVSVDTTSLMVGNQARVAGKLQYSAVESTINRDAKIGKVEATKVEQKIDFGLAVAVFSLLAAVVLVGSLISRLPLEKITQPRKLMDLFMTFLVGVAVFWSPIAVWPMVALLSQTLPILAGFLISLALLFSLAWLVLLVLSLPTTLLYITRLILGKIFDRLSLWQQTLSWLVVVLVFSLANISPLTLITSSLALAPLGFGLWLKFLRLAGKPTSEMPRVIEADELTAIQPIQEDLRTTSASPKKIAKKLESTEKEDESQSDK